MKKQFTLMVVSNRKGIVRRFVLSSGMVKTAIFAGIVFCILFAGIFVDYMGLVVTTNQNKRLKLENERLSGQFVLLESKLTSLENELEDVRTWKAKLRTITDINAEDRVFNLRVPTMAGSNTFDIARSIANVEEGPIEITEPQEEAFLKAPILDPENGRLAVYDEQSYKTLSIRLSKAVNSSQIRRYELMELWDDLSMQKSLMKSTPSISPAIGWVSSKFGYRNNPHTGNVAFHYGIDVAASAGTPVRATADGVVSYIGYDPGYGKFVSVDHGYGVVTRYGHNSQTYVVLNQTVSRGDVIAAMGNTGRSTGPHLHYEVRVHGIPVDPETYILE